MKNAMLSGFLAGPISRILLGIGSVFFLISLVLTVKDAHHFLPSYLVSFTFFLGLSMGGFFFVMVQHLSRAGWSVAFRRIPETLMANIPLMALLFVPILFEIPHLYHWAEPGAAAHDHLLQIKAPYLNIPFFVIRAIAYFAVWIWLARRFYRDSITQDSEGGEAITGRLQKLAAPGILIFSLTYTFASFDWLMSLEPHWFSTIFGIYVFANVTLACLCVVSLVLMLLRKQGFLAEIVSISHYHDLGKLIYGFVILWTYIAFSQFFLIWYANIPEETFWYVQRTSPSWKMFALVLVALHFILPLFLFMSHHVKKHLPSHAVIVSMIVIACFMDIYYIVMPTFSKSVHFSLNDVVAFLGIGGLYFAFFFRRLAAQSLIPIKDPYLSESVNLGHH